MLSQRRGWWVRLRGIIENPIAALVFITAVVASLLSLPVGDNPAARSIVGSWIGRVAGVPVGAMGTVPAVEMFARRENGQIHFINPELESWGPLARQVSDRPRGLYRILIERGSRISGFYAPTREERWLTVSVASMAKGEVLPESESQYLREACIDWMLGLNGMDIIGADLANVRSEDWRTSSVMWSGYAANLLVILQWVGLIWSLTSVRRWPAQCRAMKQRRIDGIVSGGRCPQCRYDISEGKGSIAPRLSGTCPECGGHWATSDAKSG